MKKNCAPGGASNNLWPAWAIVVVAVGLGAQVGCVSSADDEAAPPDVSGKGDHAAQASAQSIGVLGCGADPLDVAVSARAQEAQVLVRGGETAVLDLRSARPLSVRVCLVEKSGECRFVPSENARTSFLRIDLSSELTRYHFVEAATPRAFRVRLAPLDGAADDGGKYSLGLTCKAASTPPCFVAGTWISTVGGRKRIEHVKLRDRVLSFDVESEKLVVGTVTRTWVTASKPFGVVELTDGTRLKVTAEHPFYLPAGRRFVPAEQLRPEDRVIRLVTEPRAKARTLASRWREVAVKSVTFDGQRADVYNFSVDRFVNYFAEGVLVHNY